MTAHFRNFRASFGNAHAFSRRFQAVARLKAMRGRIAPQKHIVQNTERPRE